MKPRALDLFCGAGGASTGLCQAGFEVTGIDIHSQPRYPFEFFQSDALEASLAGFDLVWASPPCQRYTRAQNAAKNAHNHPDLIAPVRDKLIKWGGPWIIENVVGAPLIDPVTVCGLKLGLKVKRHRLFESNLPIQGSGCGDHRQDYYVIFGHECRNRRHGLAAGRKNRIAIGRQAMGISWMTRGELSEAIPPAYAKFLGLQVLRLLKLDKETPLNLCTS